MIRLRKPRARRSPRPSLWGIPVACMAAALVLAPLVRWLDDQTRWTLLGFGIEGARAVLGSLASSLLTFMVFAFSILLLAVQIATGLLTPRIMNRLMEGRLTRATVGMIAFAWVYSIAALGRVEDRVPQLPVALGIVLSLISVGLFLHLVQSAIKNMRPVTILTGLARDTLAVIDAVYPDRFSRGGGEHAALEPHHEAARRTLHYQGPASAVLALDIARLVDIAKRADCWIEIVPQVGDFISPGDDLFRLRGPGADAVGESELKQCVWFGPERTLEQDPAFGFRVIVDIASKALSPAINDPTTGVLAIDQLHHLLGVLGERQLDTGVVRDAAGRARLVYRTPDWEDFVTLAATEIRHFGATSAQVTRRLQAMFDQLLRTVPAQRREAIATQASLLQLTIEGAYANPQDRILALRGDTQGIGSRQPGQG
jgi:uncharacterized membrane protein